MSLPKTVQESQIEGSNTAAGDGWIVTVFDNDHNSVDEVVDVLIRATSCTLQEAEMETWEIHNLGRSVVHQGSKDECERTASIIGEIGIRVEVSQE